MLFFSCGHTRSFMTLSKNDVPCGEGLNCLCGQVVTSGAAMIEGARVVVYGEDWWFSERGRPLPERVTLLSDDDIRPGDIGGTRAKTDRLGRFCANLQPDERYLVVVLAVGKRPAAAIFPGGSTYSVAVLVEGPEFKWGL